MAYLEVRLKREAGGTIAVSANGVSLAKSTGCLASIFGSYHPSAIDYFNGLENEGWTLTSTSANRTVGMIDGLPFANSEEIYIFNGNGRYEIEWDDDGWQFKGCR